MAGTLTGAAFLMAVSAIGPGFLTQTTQFTVTLGASLAFAILISIIIDIGAQLNTWRIIGVSRRHGHEVANAVVPGLGILVTVVIVFGSFVFNIGNISGCALGLEALFGLSQSTGAVMSAIVAILLFSRPKMLSGVDWFSKMLGAGMILMTGYIVLLTRPPIGQVIRKALYPDRIDVASIVTLVGGTIGGYIMFSGAHRLLDGGISGMENLGRISNASVRGILITGVMRVVVFLAVLGVVQTGVQLNRDAPVFDAFRAGGGQIGYILSGFVFWSAAITSVVGCSYTSMTFLPALRDETVRSRVIIAFIALSLGATLGLKWLGWKLTPLLILAGTVNGILMPVVLGVVLLASRRRDIVGEYAHPWWAMAIGCIAWIITVIMAYRTITNIL
jgi:Mn2+/Fe2+ NRAMP family transporter